MKSKDKNNLTSSKVDSERRAKIELTLSEILIGQSCVVLTTRSLMVDSDRRTDDRGSQNLREKGGKRKITF